MKFQPKVALIIIGMVLCNMCAIFLLMFYVLAHPGGLVPRWISLSVLGVFTLSSVVGWILIRRASRKLATEETAEEGEQRRARAKIGLKIGLVIYGLILLNGIRLLLQKTIPWSYAIPGLAIDILLILGCSVSLRRLKKFELNAQASRPPLSQQ